MSEPTMNLDIRDFDLGQTYWVVTNPDGRCVLNGMFIAAWPTRDAAKEYAAFRGPDYRAVKQLKN